MRQYIIRVVEGDMEHSSCTHAAPNAMQAFEEAMESGSLYIPVGAEPAVIVKSDRGLCVVFAAGMHLY